MEKKTHIEKQGYTHSYIWECEFDRNIREDAKIKRFVDSIDIVTPLEPRDAFFHWNVKFARWTYLTFDKSFVC
jgi:hypothetical protein